MNKDKINIKDNVSKLGKGTLDFLSKTKNALTNAIDQNDDGKFDMQDISDIADSVSSNVKNSTQTIKNSAREKVLALELKSLKPIFEETLYSADFFLPKFIRITDRDKKYAESEVCQGSIGYFTEPKGIRLVNIFRDSITSFGISFYPDESSEFYYIDPSDRDRYIALDNYFNYLKIERISELQTLAQSLGAKYFKVTYKEEQTSFSEKQVKSCNNISEVTSLDFDHSSIEKKYSTIEIAAEMNCPGHEPVMPMLKYLQRDPSVKSLISMRMDKTSPLSHQKFMIQLSNSSGIKESDAAKIDAVLKSMKCSSNTTVASEAKNESRRYLDYEIDF